MQDKDRLLRTFLAVARAGSLRAASTSLGITQAAVSKQVAALEAFLGAPLFDRHGRGMRPTPLGERLVGDIDQGFGMVDSALDVARQTSAGGYGRVTIATVNTLAAYLMPEVVASLRAAHPRITLGVFNASSPDVVERVERGLADIGLVYDLAVDTDAVALRRLCIEQIAAYSREPGAPTPGTLSVAALAQRPLIVPPRPYALRRVIERELPAPLSIAVESNSVSMSLDLAMQGVGTTILPRDLPDIAITARGLHRLAIEGANLHRHVVLIHRSGTTPSQAVSRAIRAIEAAAARIATR